MNKIIINNQSNLNSIEVLGVSKEIMRALEKEKIEDGQEHFSISISVEEKEYTALIIKKDDETKIIITD